MDRGSPELPSGSLELRCMLSCSLRGPPGNSSIRSPTPESSGSVHNSSRELDLFELRVACS
eukprot:1532883-Alexandrium_andersonii.AAC.1